MGMKYRDPSTGQLKELSLKAADTLPIGTIVAYSGSNEPSGWLICDGRAISRTSYSNLFNVIGTTYGAGDGSTTFNLPDYRDRVPVGLDSNDSDFDTLGKTGGEKEHKLIVNEIPSHNHAITYYPGGAGANTGGTFALGSNPSTSKAYTQTTGGDQAHNNLQPYIVTNYIIKAEKSVGVLGKILNLFSNSNKDTYSCNYINNQLKDVYSAEEVKTNKVWFGKPVYRKTIFINSLPSDGNIVRYNHNISNIDEGWFDIQNSFIIWHEGESNQFSNTFPFSNYNGDSIWLFDFSKTDFGIKTTRDRSNLKAYVTLLYTKTTD